MTCTMILIKVKKSCAARRPHSLVQTPSGSSGKTDQDGWRWDWMQWMTNSVLRVSLCSLCIPQCTAGGRLHVRFTVQSAEVQTSHAWVDIPENHQEPRSLAPHLVLPACRSGLPGCGHCACYSYLEPQVRVGCLVETKDKHITL